MTEAEKWILGCTIIGAACAVGALVVAVIALNKKQETVISPQPLAVTIVEEMHKRFASKEAFDDLAKNNTARHSQLFAGIKEVDEKSRALIEKKIAEINEDRRHTLERIESNFDDLHTDMRDMPGKIVVDVLNAQKIGRKHD